MMEELRITDCELGSCGISEFKHMDFEFYIPQFAIRNLQ